MKSSRNSQKPIQQTVSQPPTATPSPPHPISDQKTDQLINGVKPIYPSGPLPLLYRVVGDKEWSEVGRAEGLRVERDRVKVEVAEKDIGKFFGGNFL